MINLDVRIRYRGAKERNMGELKFSDKYRDLWQQHGVSTGFQMAVKGKCSVCGAELSPSVKFCPEHDKPANEPN